VAPGAATTVTSRPTARRSVGLVEAVHRSQVQEKPEAGASTGCSQRSDVAEHNRTWTPTSRARLRAADKAGDEVDAGQLPASFCQVHGRESGPAAEVERSAKGREETLFHDLFRRADELDEGPLHGFLVGLRVLSETMSDLPTGHPGCLVAAYCYQDRLFDREVRDLYTAAKLGWRRRFRKRLEWSQRANPTYRS
jgi:hypothetical protein